MKKLTKSQIRRFLGGDALACGSMRPTLKMCQQIRAELLKPKRGRA